MVYLNIATGAYLCGMLGWLGFGFNTWQGLVIGIPVCVVLGISGGWRKT